MTPTDITGRWVQENAVPMGGGVMRIASAWTFAADGGATLATESVLEHDGRAVTRNAASHAGRWSIEADTLVVQLPDHADSPFKLSMTETGELKARRRGVWRRPPAG